MPQPFFCQRWRPPGSSATRPFRNPAIPIAAGRWSLGIEYFYDNGNFKPHDSAHFDTARSYMDEAYARAAYGAFEGSEIFLKLGAADMHSNEAFFDGSDFDQGYALSAGAGVKQSFEVMPGVRVGGLVQGAAFSDHDRTKPYPGFNDTLRVKDQWEADLAFAASYEGNGWAPTRARYLRGMPTYSHPMPQAQSISAGQPTTVRPR